MNVPGCAGQCCAVFPWGTPPDQMRRVWENAPGAEWEVGEWGNGLDQLMIADMLVPLTHDEAVERAEKFDIRDDFVKLCEEDGKQLYTCRHWDEDTRMCTVYDARPDMCAAYPYEGECFHCNVRGGCKSHTGWRKREAMPADETC